MNASVSLASAARVESRAETPLQAPLNAQRVLAVDALRGIAMLFVGISHISHYIRDDSVYLALLMRWCGYFASPNFLLISGLACGYQLQGSPGNATVLRIVDRGLFVLLVGHILVCGSLVYDVSSGSVFEHIVITDTIGLVLCSAPLIRYLTIRQLVVGGCALFVSSAAVALAWHPSTPAGEDTGALLFSIEDRTLEAAGWVTPTFAYFAIFLVGVGLGKLVRRVTDPHGRRVLAARLATMGAAAVLVSVWLNIVKHHLRLALGEVATRPWAYALLQSADVRGNHPPTPAYALFYGGLGFAMIGSLILFLREDAPARVPGPVRVAAVFGRASFVSYVCLQWLVDFAPEGFGFAPWLNEVSSMAYLATALAVVYWIARAWDRHHANRYLTLGLTEIPHLRRAAARAR